MSFLEYVINLVDGLRIVVLFIFLTTNGISFKLIGSIMIFSFGLKISNDATILSDEILL